jgi:2-polyprenyl-6-methoxyphenol hydroxylase-like FAD-dependent oxidoreductase
MSAELDERDRFGGRRAVVIGGSVAGLVTARVLADHFDRVDVIERDAIADADIEPRKGVPQGYHVHLLLARGEEVLGGLFPGLRAALAADGAVHYDFGNDVAWHHFGGWKKRFPSGIIQTGVSRPLLESHIRRRVFALPNVRRRDAHDAIGLVCDAARARVTGVTVKRRNGGAEEERIDADLVVDASGRGTKLPAWLEALGFGRPVVAEVRVKVGYATRLYRRPDPWPYDWSALYILGTAPENRRGGAILPREGGLLYASCAGSMGDHSPADPDGYRAFAQSLPVSEMHRVLGELEPASDVVTYTFPANLRRHYERMARFPEGLAVVGDAMVSFNPIYAQGMTAAALAAQALGAELTRQRLIAGRGEVQGLARRYLAVAAKLADTPWMMSTTEDFRDPDVAGERPPLYGAMKWYLGRVHRAVQMDTDVFGTFLRAMHMLDAPETLMMPRTALRVLRAAHRAPGG